MTDTVMPTKRCSGCKENKALGEFYKNRAKADGLNRYCKTCWNGLEKKYGQTPQGKARRLAQVKRYQATDKGRATTRRVDDKRAKTPQVRARACVRCDVYRGKLLAPSALACAECGEQAAHYHHHLGYEREHWKHVIPLCGPCHRKADAG